MAVALASAAFAAEPLVLNPDGAWCWFQDERALVYDGKLSAASISRTGDVQVTTWDFKRGSVGISTLHEHFPIDDHNVPGLLLRADGHLMAFYTEHGGLTTQNPMRLRVSLRPRDATAWQPEQTFRAGVQTGASYANPFQLSAEHGRIYLFWRGIDFNPTWSCSDDGGRTWRPAANHIYYRRGERPYVKYASNGVDTIHFAYTDGHPEQPYWNSLYHAYYRNGGLYRSDGTFVRKLAEGPLQVAEGTRIYDGQSPTGKAWVWDLHLDKSGKPVVVYTSHPSPMDQRYRYARWNGKAWEDREVAYAGKRLYPGEEYYAGGIALDPDQLNVIYISSDVDIGSGKPNASGHYEIYKGVTRDGGKTWAWTALTRDSRLDNLRPIVPAHHPGATFVLWYRGQYSTYTKFETEVVAYTDAKLPPVRERVSFNVAGAPGEDSR